MLLAKDGARERKVYFFLSFRWKVPFCYLMSVFVVLKFLFSATKTIRASLIEIKNEINSVIVISCRKENFFYCFINVILFTWIFGLLSLTVSISCIRRLYLRHLLTYCTSFLFDLMSRWHTQKFKRIKVSEKGTRSRKRNNINIFMLELA